MLQLLIAYPNTDRRAVTGGTTVTISTVIPANSICLNIGELGIMSGENKLKKAWAARAQLLDRIRNVLKASASGRVEAYNEGSLSTFSGNTTGLSNDAFVSIGYNLAGVNQAQATEFIAGGAEVLLRAAKDRLYAGGFATLKP